MSVRSVQELIREGVRPFSEVPGLEGYSHEAITRWVKIGRLSVDGRRVRLEAVRHPSEWRTTEQAVARFFAALAGEEALVGAA